MQCIHTLLPTASLAACEATNRL